MSNRLDCLLIRHGRTKGNEEKRYTGKRTDESLSKKGKNECRQLESKLRALVSSEKMIVISGGLRRCMETAGIIFPGIDLFVDESLTEIDFGDFEGKNYIELQDDAEYIKWLESNGSIPFPGGESREEFVKRSLRAFEENVFRYSQSGRMLAFVCHGGNIMSVMSSLTGRDYFDFQAGCCEGYKLSLEVGEDGIDLVSYNSLVRGHSA